MNIGFKFIFNSFRFNNPLISAITIFMNKFSGFVIVNGLNLSFSVLNIGTLDFEILDKHFCEEERKE